MGQDGVDTAGRGFSWRRKRWGGGAAVGGLAEGGAAGLGSRRQFSGESRGVEGKPGVGPGEGPMFPALTGLWEWRVFCGGGSV